MALYQEILLIHNPCQLCLRVLEEIAMLLDGLEKQIHGLLRYRRSVASPLTSLYHALYLILYYYSSQLGPCSALAHT